MKDLFAWLVRSSADPEKLSLTVKGALSLAGSFVLKATVLACGLGLYCLGIDAEWVAQVVNIVGGIAYHAAAIVGSVAAVCGLIRKAALKRWAAPLPPLLPGQELG